jgi:hypothetical protein
VSLTPKKDPLPGVRFWVVFQDELTSFELRISGSAGIAEINLDSSLIVRRQITAINSISSTTMTDHQEELGKVRLDAATGLMPFLEFLRSGNSNQLVSIKDALSANSLIDRLYKNIQPVHSHSPLV